LLGAPSSAGVVDRVVSAVLDGEEEADDLVDLLR
jgi:hypothetical protein